jgi:tetratricopeptide (TPR) repeat protein
MINNRLITIFQRPFFLYLILVALSFRFIDRDKAMVNYLNNFSSLEAYLSALADETAEFDRIRLIEGTHYYQQLSSCFPKDAIWQGNLGFCYFSLERYNDAYKAFTAASRLEPENYSYHFDKGAVLVKLKKPYQAMTSYYRSIKLTELVESSYAEAIKTLVARKDQVEVHKIYNMVIEEKKDRKYLVKYLRTLGAYLKKSSSLDQKKIEQTESAIDFNFEKILTDTQAPVYVHYRSYHKK